MAERSVEEILEILRKHGIGLIDICRVIVYWYDMRIFDNTAVGRLRDAERLKKALEKEEHHLVRRIIEDKIEELEKKRDGRG